MLLAAVQPVKFWVDEITIRINEAFQSHPDRYELFHVSAQANLELAVNAAQVRFYKCRMRLEAHPWSSDTPLPYEVKAAVGGTFVMVPELRPPDLETESQQDQYAIYNGLAILYGFARDVVFQQTSLGPYGGMMFPAVDAASLAAQMLEAVAEGAPDEQT